MPEAEAEREEGADGEGEHGGDQYQKWNPDARGHKPSLEYSGVKQDLIHAESIGWAMDDMAAGYRRPFARPMMLVISA